VTCWRPLLTLIARRSVPLRSALGEQATLTAYAPWEADNALSTINKDALRLIREYLPLSFSRRHGDPSRPVEPLQY
jgi:hypothetical protein